MAVRRRNAGRPRRATLAQLRKRARPSLRRGSKSAAKELRRRGKKVPKRAKNNPRRSKNPRNAYTAYVSRWRKKGKSMGQIAAMWRKLKRKPTAYVDKKGRKRKAGDQKRMGRAWIRFLKRNKSKNYTMKQLGRLFRKDPSANLKPKPAKKRKAAPKRRRTTAKRKTATRKSTSRAKGRKVSTSRKRKLTPFQRFQKANAGKGWNSTRMGREWAKKKGGTTSSVASHYRSSITGKSGYIKPAKKYRTAWDIVGKKKPSKHSWAPTAAAANGLALTNGIALTNPSFGDLLSPAFYWDTLREDVVPVAMGMSLGAGAHAAAAAFGGTTMLMDGIDDAADWIGSTIPVVGPWAQTGLQAATTHAPFTIQGSAVFIASGVAAGLVGKGATRSLLAGLGTSALAFGTGMDLFNAFTGLLSGVSAEEMIQTEEAVHEAVSNMGGLALQNGLALDNMGGLALDNMGGLAMQNMGGLAYANSSYGDGFAYETAPVQAAQLNYGQSSPADAYYSGADFSNEEGDALVKGAGAWSAAFGPTPYRPKGDASNASHLAGKPGHRWGWLIQTVGWEKAREICSLEPKKRLKVIQSMRQSALDAWRRETASTGYGDPVLFMG